MNYTSKLSEELKRAVSLNEKIRILEVGYNELLQKVDELNEPSKQRQARAASKGTMTAKAMCAKLGITGDGEKYMALKFFARKYCEEHGLTIASNTDKKKHDQFPLAAAEYAMQQVGKK